MTDSDNTELQSISSKSFVSQTDMEPRGLLAGHNGDNSDLGNRVTRRFSEPSSIKTTDTGRSSIVTGVSRTLSKTITAIKRAVEDDNLQTEEDKDSLNRLLENHFDLEDALRLTDTNQAAARRQYSQAKLSDEEDSAVGSLEKEPTLKKVFTNKTTNALDLPPDGGYGWVCCLCVTLIMFSTWGCNSAFGVFLAFYLSNSSFAGANKYDYALIAGITVFFAQGLPPIVMILMRVFGFKAPMYFGIVLMCAGFVLASYSTKLWQLYLTQGVMSGIAISLIFAPATTVLPGWFLKKRSFAMGLSLVGTGAGGVVYSLAVNKLIENTGNQKKASFENLGHYV